MLKRLSDRIATQATDERHGSAEPAQTTGDIGGRATQIILHRLIHSWVTPRGTKAIHQGLTKADHGWRFRHLSVMRLN